MVNLTDFIKESLNHNDENLSLYESILENINEDEYDYINEGLILFFKNLWAKFKNLFNDNDDVFDNIRKIEDNKLRSDIATLLALSLEKSESELNNNDKSSNDDKSNKSTKDDKSNKSNKDSKSTTDDILKTLLSTKKYGNDIEKNIIKIGNNLLTSLPDDSSFPLAVQSALNHCTSKDAKYLSEKLKTAIKKKYDENNIVDGSKKIKQVQNGIDPKFLKKLKITKNN
jgi:hypothetical protein